MAKVFIATPMYGGMCTGHYVQSLLQLVATLSSAGHQTHCAFMFNESLITRGRNQLASQFLETDCTHLFWIDADIKFYPHDVVRMLDSGKEFIGGIYPKKEINWNNVRKAVKDGVKVEDLTHYTGSFVVNLVGDAREVSVPRDQPCEVANLGTGFLLTKRSVYEKLAEVTPTYTSDMGASAGKKMHAFFLDPICEESNRLLSEDYYFCTQWRKHGGQVFAAPWVRLGHMGSYLFDGHLIEDKRNDE